MKGNLKKLWKYSLDTPKNRLERSFVRWFIYTLIFLVVYVLFITKDNVFNWMAARRTVASQQKEISRLNREIDEMDARLDALSSKDSLEKFAREQYLFSEPGEDVYIVK